MISVRGNYVEYVITFYQYKLMSIFVFFLLISGMVGPILTGTFSDHHRLNCENIMSKLVVLKVLKKIIWFVKYYYFIRRNLDKIKTNSIVNNIRI